MENVIAHIKQRFAILTCGIPLSELAFMDKIFYTCCMLLNLSTQKIH